MTWVRLCCAVAVAVLTVGSLPAAGARAEAGPALTVERLAELARARTYGTPVEIPVPGRGARALWLTDSGVVVGRTVVDTDPRLFRWRGGRTTLLPQPAGEPDRLEAAGVNEAGDVLGFSGRWAQWGVVRPFVWQADGTVRSLTDAGTWAGVVGITDAGVVVGTLTDGRPVTWQDGVLTDLPEPAGAVPGTTTVHAVNARGEIAGNAVGADGVEHAYVWRRGTPTQLPAPAGAWVSRITDDGDVIGATGSGDATRAVVWDDGVRMRAIDPTGAFGVEVVDVSSRGVVVGNASREERRGAVRVEPRRSAVTPLPGLGGERVDSTSRVADVHDLDLAVGAATPVDAYFAMPVVWVRTVPVPLGARIDGEQAWSGEAVAVNRRGQVVGHLFTEWTETRVGERVVLWDLVPRR